MQDLQENAHKLRELPHRKLGIGFAGQVLRAIAERGLQPAPAAHQGVARPRLPRWVGYAIAASLVVAVGFGIYFATRGQPRVTSDIVAVGAPAVEPEVLPAPHRQAHLQMAFKDLVKQPQRELLARQIQKQTAVYLDVTVRNNARAVERLQEVLGKRGIKTIVDARTAHGPSFGGAGQN